MANFSEYPYINYTDINLDWIMKRIKSLVEEWLRYNDVWADWQRHTEKDFEDLKSYVDDYFANLDIDEAVYREVVRVVNETISESYIISILNNYLQQSPRTIKGNVELNTYQDSLNINGGCYVGNGRLVIYFAPTDSNTGKLECYDLTQKARLWSYDIEGYHGNSVTYYNNRVYICAAYSYTATATLIPTIVVVNLDNPSVIETIITPPVEGIYSLCYGNNKFYAITNRGTTEGEANMLTIFDTDFNIERTMLLPDYPAVNGFSTQGIPCYYNNILYAIDYTNAAIVGYDATTGEKVFQAGIESYFNNYRYVGEVEFLTCDTTNGEFYLGSSTVGGGETGVRYGSVARLGLYKDIPVRRVMPENTVVPSGLSAIGRINVNFSRVIAPTGSVATFHNMTDAINLSKNAGQACVIVISGYDGFAGLSFMARDFRGMIVGNTPLKTVYLQLEGCQCVLQNLNFNNERSMTNFWGTYTGVALISNSRIVIRNCTNDNGMINAQGCDIFESGCNNMRYNLNFSHLHRTNRNVFQTINATATCSLSTRLLASRLAVGTAYQSGVTGLTLAQLFGGNVKIWGQAGTVITPYTYTIDTSNDTLTILNGTTSLAVLKWSSTAGTFTPSAVTNNSYFSIDIY